MAMLLTLQQIRELRNLKEQDGIRTFDLNCGSTLTVSAVGGAFNGSVSGYRVMVADPHNFVGVAGSASDPCEDKPILINNKVSMYIGIKALPMLRVIALALTPRPMLRELASATADMVEEESLP